MSGSNGARTPVFVELRLPLDCDPGYLFPVLSTFYRSLDGAAECLAMSFAFAFRNGLEDAHTVYGEKHGLGHEVIIPLNKRLARHCYERIGRQDLLSFLQSADPTEWVDEMWRVGLADSGALTHITAPARALSDARLKAIKELGGAIKAWLAMLEVPSRENMNALMNVMPADWDDPSKPLRT